MALSDCGSSDRSAAFVCISDCRYNIPFTFLVACIVAIWIICNEIISILENIKDMGVAIPGFLLPIVEHVKSQVEDKADINKDSEGE